MDPQVGAGLILPGSAQELWERGGYLHSFPEVLAGQLCPLKPVKYLQPAKQGKQGELGHELLTASLSSWPRLLGQVEAQGRLKAIYGH